MANTEASQSRSLLDFPEDILAVVFSYLPPADFLHFCSVSRNVYLKYRHDPFYWMTNASRTFRLPISPLLRADGPRWYWLYKKLKTQTRLYTWGQGIKQNLARGHPVGRRHVPVVAFQRSASSWPTEAHVDEEIGVIVDLQCGGWSTSILTSEGKLYSVGILDAADGRHTGRMYEDFQRLEYLSQSTSSIRQFSSGRRHVLALTDHDEVFTWDRINAKGYKVYPRAAGSFGGKPRRVAAGWGQSSVYIPEIGIIYWQPVRNDREDIHLDGIHVPERTVPGTAREVRVVDGKDHTVEVLTHILLENFLIYITSESKLFACQIGDEAENQAQPSHSPFEVPGYASAARQLMDLQGSFRSFAVFTATGEVLAGDTHYLRRCYDKIEELRGSASSDLDSQEPRSISGEGLPMLVSSRPQDVRALQHAGVIELAFGDYHFLALHANGSITVYGYEPQGCGALGLGDRVTGQFFRGVELPEPFQPGRRQDAKLLPIAARRGRQVWFEPEKRKWLSWLSQQFQEAASLPSSPWSRTSRMLVENRDRQAAFSEWIEQQGRNWTDGPSHGTRLASAATATNSEQATDVTHTYDNLAAYFAISVAAAGWHSGALVLVDDAKAEQTRRKWCAPREELPPRMPGQFEAHDNDEHYVWETQGLPHIKLPGGIEIPGEGNFEPWRDGMPTLDDLGLTDAVSGE